MHRTFSLGAIALTLASSALVPGIAEPARAAESPSVASAAPATPLAIRDADSTPAPVEGLQQIAPPVRIATSTPAVVKVIRGQASWYGPGFYGRRTASGERFRRGTLTAAHRTLPFGTKVRVTNLRNGRSTVVRINDRGPFHGNRVIDLAHGAASEVGLTASGLAPVKLEVLR
ncbi:rare lipoprotein A [Cyanobium sp. PCC 7001]|uniref:septal ring lytic transglycosylase RlpA family protein n=1 Tax=Cyanobium sp. PCC 7001 TaxID=180281 RepID=UPI000180556E|nr:septal ring lytic transglycosylase RlpA family protein [Cyanobium sp. PCC 7001]EDY39862.1 rare lipoprotein A [Cyanobium sp. PCC 7001]